MNYLKKDVYLMKTIISSVLSICGILTVVFAILSLANVSSVQPDVVLRYVAGVALIISGCIVIILDCAKKPHQMDIRSALLGSLVIGIGVFLMLEEGNTAITTIITLILPMSVACIGGGVFIKGLVALLTLKTAKPDEVKNIKVRGFFLVFFGAVFIVVGTLLCVFKNEKNLKNVIWLIAGLFISCYAFVTLIQSARELKKIVKKEKEMEKPEKESDVIDSKDNNNEEEVKVIEQKNNGNDNTF